MGNAKFDDNNIPTWIGVSSADGTTPVTIYVDPTTHRVLTSSSSFTDLETPSGTINGSNATFTLAAAPNPAGSLMLFLNGAYQTAAGVDYTLSSLTITFVLAPPSGSVLRAHYRT